MDMGLNPCRTVRVVEEFGRVSGFLCEQLCNYCDTNKSAVIDTVSDTYGLRVVLLGREKKTQVCSDVKGTDRCLLEPIELPEAFWFCTCISGSRGQ